MSDLALDAQPGPERAPAQFGAWATVVVPIAAWTVHMVALASMIELTCEHAAVEWVLHGLTAALALVCVACALAAWRIARRPDGSDEGSATANIRFLSHVGIAVALFNVVLIVLEGLYVVFIDACTKAGH